MNANTRTQQAGTVNVLTVPTPATKITLGGEGPYPETFDLYRKKFG